MSPLDEQYGCSRQRGATPKLSALAICIVSLLASGVASGQERAVSEGPQGLRTGLLGWVGEPTQPKPAPASQPLATAPEKQPSALKAEISPPAAARTTPRATATESPMSGLADLDKAERASTAAVRSATSQALLGGASNAISEDASANGGEGVATKAAPDRSVGSSMAGAAASPAPTRSAPAPSRAITPLMASNAALETKLAVSQQATSATALPRPGIDDDQPSVPLPAPASASAMVPAAPAQPNPVPLQADTSLIAADVARRAKRIAPQQTVATTAPPRPESDERNTPTSAFVTVPSGALTPAPPQPKPVPPQAITPLITAGAGRGIKTITPPQAVATAAPPQPGNDGRNPPVSVFVPVPSDVLASAPPQPEPEPVPPPPAITPLIAADVARRTQTIALPQAVATAAPPQPDNDKRDPSTSVLVPVPSDALTPQLPQPEPVPPQVVAPVAAEDVERGIEAIAPQQVAAAAAPPKSESDERNQQASVLAPVLSDALTPTSSQPEPVPPQVITPLIAADIARETKKTVRQQPVAATSRIASDAAREAEPNTAPEAPRSESERKPAPVSVPEPIGVKAEAPNGLPPLDLRLPQLSADPGDGSFNVTGNEVFSQWLSEHASTEKQPWDRENLSDASVRTQFARLVEAAALRSPRVRQARAQYEASLSDVKSVKGQRWPQVDITTSTAAVPIGGSRDDDNPALGSALQANIVTPIYDFGRLKKTIHSYEQLADASYQTYQAELQNSASQVSFEAIELIKNKILAEISDGYVNRLGTLVEMLSDIVKVDTGRGSELTQAKARFLQAEASRDAILARIRDQELALRKLVGDTPLPAIGTESWDIQPGDLERQLAMLDQHPLVLKARAETASAVSSAEAIKSSAWPQLNWVVSKTTAEDALGRSQPWETRLGLSWAAFRGGSQRAQRQAALARAEAGRQIEEQQRLDLEYQIRGAEHDARVLFDRADSYRALTDETEQVRRAFFQQWYHLGKRTLLDVLSAESEYHNNQVNEVNSRFDGYRAVFDGYLSAGTLASWLRQR